MTKDEFRTLKVGDVISLNDERITIKSIDCQYHYDHSKSPSTTIRRNVLEVVNFPGLRGYGIHINSLVVKHIELVSRKGEITND